MPITTDRKISNAQPAAKSLPVVDLFTDGSCRGKKQRIGGWAFILRHRSTGVEKVQSGGLHKSSSEQAEIHAVINGLSALKLRSHVLLHCDNIGVVNGISQFLPEWKRFGWRLSPKAKQLINNVDLWQALDALLAKHDVTVKWVKGHAGHPDNERCDQLSGKATDELLKNGGALLSVMPTTTTLTTPAVKSTAAQNISTSVKSDEKLHEVDLFTDGACIGNPGPGGWAFILRPRATGKEKEHSGGLRDTTNNRMEMLAVIEGLAALKRRSRVTLHSDSQYVVQGIGEWMAKWKRFGWRKTPKSRTTVKNTDLWQRMDALVSQHEVAVNWVRGHAGHPENERCDVLSVKAAEAVAKNPNSATDVRVAEVNGLGLFENRDRNVL